MPRQNFLSRETFVEAGEEQTKDSLLSLPAFVPHIKFVAENPVLQSTRFYYQVLEKNIEYTVDVTVLPLNSQYTRIGFHGKHTSGQAFDNDASIAMALHEFESALQAALGGDVSQFRPFTQKKRTRSLLQSLATVVGLAGVFVMKRKFS